MNAREGTAPDTHSRTYGALSLVMGLLACVGVTVIWLVSSTSLDLPGWARVLSGWMFPVGALGALALGIMARARRSGTALATLGFVLAGASVIEFAVMIAMNPY